MITLILANGELHLSPELLELSKEADYIIAADGGANHCEQLNCIPDIIIGDLDSISDRNLLRLKKSGSEVLQFPVRKDATDLELAIDHAAERGTTEIYCAGLLGGRWDMSLSNIFLLASEKYKDLQCTLFGDECTMHILHPGEYSFATQLQQRASIIPLNGDGKGVTLSGFEYPLDNYTIHYGSTIGLSNVVCSQKVHIKHSDGVLLVIFS
ncbi:thiamine diphosphokinase [Desulforhopalus sp. 52FAK]